MTEGLFGCNPERSHSGPCGADDCWWTQMVGSLDALDRPDGVPAKRNAEQNEILGWCVDLLSGPVGDGATKRAAGLKPYWKDDPGHLAARNRHGAKWEAGQRYDAHSGCHHLVHEAARGLMIAFQEMSEDGLIPEDPR